MAQLDFFLNKNERLDLVDFALKNGCKLVPDLHYDENAYFVIDTIERYLEFSENNPMFFLMSDAYSLYSLELGSFEKAAKRKYFIQQRHGGPTIDIYFASMSEAESKIVGPSFIGIYPFYYHNDVKFIPGQGLKDMYNLFTTFIKKHSRKVTLRNRTYWVGNSTIELVKKGEYRMTEISNINLVELL